MTSPSPIEDYLDELAELLRSSGARQRGFLLEVEAHLHDGRDTRIAGGDEPSEAEAAAIRAFGTAREVARAENRADWRAARGTAASETVRLLLTLATAGMVVVGIAGLLARVIANFGLMDAMYGLPADVVMPAASCAHWLAVQPAATTCIQAGTLEASDDLTMVYLAVGALGLLFGIPSAVSRSRRRAARRALPSTLGPAVATAMFAAAALGLCALGATNAVISTTWGQGMWFTDAACAAAACVVSLLILLRRIQDSDARSVDSGARQT